MKYPEGKSTEIESRSVVPWNSDWEQELTINRHGSRKEGGPCGPVGVMKMFENQIVVMSVHLYKFTKNH